MRKGAELLDGLQQSRMLKAMGLLTKPGKAPAPVESDTFSACPPLSNHSATGSAKPTGPAKHARTAGTLRWSLEASRTTLMRSPKSWSI